MHFQTFNRMLILPSPKYGTERYSFKTDILLSKNQINMLTVQYYTHINIIILRQFIL